MPPEWRKRRNELSRAVEEARERQEQAANELQRIARSSTPAGAGAADLAAARASYVEAQNSYFAALDELSTFVMNERLFAQLYASEIREGEDNDAEGRICVNG